MKYRPPASFYLILFFHGIPGRLFEQKHLVDNERDRRHGVVVDNDALAREFQERVHLIVENDTVLGRFGFRKRKEQETNQKFRKSIDQNVSDIAEHHLAVIYTRISSCHKIYMFQRAKRNPTHRKTDICCIFYSNNLVAVFQKRE